MLRVAASMRQRGFSVWVDTEMMSGSTLDAMAAAVENAYCVLICITERYKVRARSQMLAMSLRRCKGQHSHASAGVARVQGSANCRLEGTCASWARCSARASACTKMHDRLCLLHTVAFFCAADVHEQKKPWVPLMLEASYRPSGWLGIMCVACR